MFRRNCAGTFNVSCGMFSNAIVLSPSFVLWHSDTVSENTSLIRLSLSCVQKTCGSKDVSLIDIL